MAEEINNVNEAMLALLEAEILKITESLSHPLPPQLPVTPAVLSEIEAMLELNNQLLNQIVQELNLMMEAQIAMEEQGEVPRQRG